MSADESITIFESPEVGDFASPQYPGAGRAFGGRCLTYRHAVDERRRWMMTSRERVLAAIEHRQPDRVPVDKDICFWGGGCDTRTILNRATPAQVRAHVLERMQILSPGGGFVFNTVHNILPEVSARNIVAMYEAVAEFNA